VDTTPPISTQSIAQAHASERAVQRPGEARKASDPRARRRPEDVYESIASASEGAQAVRRAGGNDQEDAHEDREEHAPAERQAPGDSPKAPKLDIRG